MNSLLNMKYKHYNMSFNHDFTLLESTETDSDGNLCLTIKYDENGRILRKEDNLGNWTNYLYDMSEEKFVPYLLKSKSNFTFLDTLVLEANSNLFL